MANLSTFYCAGMAISDEQAVEFFKDQNVEVICRDGSKWLRGEQIIPPPGYHMDVTRLNEKIAGMELPSYLEQLQPLTPEQKSVYTLGEWGRAERGEDHG